MPYTDSGRNSTSTDHRLQTEKPTCSEKIEKNRLRRATRRPGDSQNSGSSGRQSSIHPRRGTDGGAAGTVVDGVVVDGGRGGAGMQRRAPRGISPPSPRGRTRVSFSPPPPTP